jgi:hypothetical protein
LAAERTKTIVLSCPVMRDFLGPRVAASGVCVIYMDYGLHVRPKRMAPVLQAELDALTEPHTVLLGYGLCGTGLVGLSAGPHTLIIPRADDCIAILLGSHDAYVQAQGERPGTYYLTRGWLEAEQEPLSEYRGYVTRFGQEAADYVIDAMYAHYTALCFVASTAAELDDCRQLIDPVAQFCAERWGMGYEARVGSAALVERLLDAPRNPGRLGQDLIVVRPGGSVELWMFARD